MSKPFKVDLVAERLKDLRVHRAYLRSEITRLTALSGFEARLEELRRNEKRINDLIESQS